MLKVYTNNFEGLLQIVIEMHGSKYEYDAGIYDDVMTKEFGIDYKNSKKFKYLRGKDRCDEVSTGLGWYLMKVFLGKTRLRRADIYRFVKKGEQLGGQNG